MRIFLTGHFAHTNTVCQSLRDDKIISLVNLKLKRRSQVHQVQNPQLPTDSHPLKKCPTCPLYFVPAVSSMQHDTTKENKKNETCHLTLGAVALTLKTLTDPALWKAPTPLIHRPWLFRVSALRLARTWRNSFISRPSEKACTTSGAIAPPVRCHHHGD